MITTRRYLNVKLTILARLAMSIIFEYSFVFGQLEDYENEGKVSCVSGSSFLTANKWISEQKNISEKRKNAS